MDSLLVFLVLSVLATVTLAILFPAGSAYAFHQIPRESEAALRAIVTSEHNHYYERVRNGDLAVLDAGVRGMVAFPSFHTVLGVMAILYLRANFWLLVPVALLSMAMIASTPLIGGHFFVDILGGIAVALLSFVAAERLVRGRVPQFVPVAP